MYGTGRNLSISKKDSLISISSDKMGERGPTRSGDWSVSSAAEQADGCTCKQGFLSTECFQWMGWEARRPKITLSHSRSWIPTDILWHSFLHPRPSVTTTILRQQWLTDWNGTHARSCTAGVCASSNSTSTDTRGYEHTHDEMKRLLPPLGYFARRW